MDIFSTIRYHLFLNSLRHVTITVFSRNKLKQFEPIMRKNTGPILLIVLGILLLLSNLEILPLGQIKALLKQWWPLILVIIGIIQLRSPR